MILNWNGKQYLHPCLSSVIQDACRHVEVVLVDNGSTDDSSSIAQRDFPSLRVVAHPENLGYSAGYNAAIDQVSGRYLVFLNNDTVVENGWLAPLIDELVHHPQVALTTSKLLLLGTRVIHTAGGQLKLWQGSMELGFGRDETFFSGRSVAPFHACGAAMAIPRELFQRLGGFDEYLPLYCEDLDLSWRARLAGYTVVCVTQSVVYHHLSGTSGVLSPVKLRLVTTHHLAVMIKCLSLVNLLHSLPAYSMFALVKGGAVSIIELNPGYFTSVVIALRDTARTFGKLRQRRQEAQRRRVAPDRQVLKSDGFGLFESPWRLLQLLRLSRRLKHRPSAPGSGEPSPNATLGS